MCQPLCIGSQCHETRKLITKTYIKVFKGKTQFIIREKRGRRNIGSNYNSKARDTSRSCQIKNTRERERDQTHSYWYIPSAPRVNYSLLVMESAGMMNMATGEGFPPPAGCRNGSRLAFGGYGGFWRRNSRSIFFWKF